MNPADLQGAWARQAQLDAERGVIECRVCRAHASLADTITLWRNGALVFASCHACMRAHEIHIRPSDAGLEVRARRRQPLIVGGR